ncbi:MAG: lipopolysaccharide kinase InaA family protein [Nitrososphaerota archaeon]|nr:hypothetical protein [Candidatus Calditenuaceae archaeon]MDW8073765.1 lipopolysaccharide kinase InaA family protein [Nitrososphaerota archaeon]
MPRLLSGLPQTYGGSAGESIIAVLEYPVKSDSTLLFERLTLIQREAPGVEVVTDEGRREVLASVGLMKRDVSHSVLGDTLAIRLLTPLNPIHGNDTINQLQSQYLKRIVRRVVDFVVESYELAAIHVRLHPLYFLLRWLKPKLALMPSMTRLFWWLDSRDGSGEAFLSQVLARVRAALDVAAREEGLLQKAGELYALNPSRVLQARVSVPKPRLKLPFNPQVVKVVKEPRLAVDALRLILAEVQTREPLRLENLNPDEWAYVQTMRGLQRISQDEPLIEAVKKHLSLGDSTVKIDRKGSLLNSTYLLQIYDDGAVKDKLFVKRYFSWTDVKWVAAKLWAMPLRNFYFSPATRMSNEIFFLNYLAEKRFRVPHVVYLSWEEKALVEDAIEGYNLTEAWTRERARLDEGLLERITVGAGEMLASLHEQGLVVGDCKSDNFMVSQASNEIWLVDLEQAALRGDQSWDLSELILYMGHYLDLYEAERYASLIARGYLSKGRPEVVESALDGKFQLAMLPWTPIWTQVWMLRSVERELRR